jgi:hypothetical protein
MLGTHAIFLDTSFLSEARLEDLTDILNSAEPKYITDRVYEEIKKGYLNNSGDERFRHIFQKNGELKGKIRVVSLEKCVKDPLEKCVKDSLIVDFSRRKIIFKRNSLICSAYYGWLPWAVNPSVVTDPFRHMYNEALALIRKEGDRDHQISMRLGNLQQKEIDLLDQFRKGEGDTRKPFGVSVLKTARKKRLKDFKRNTLILTDYQIVLTALLYVCVQRAHVMVLTCDKDLLDINHNLMRCGIEKYVINRILTERMNRATVREAWHELKFLYRTEIFAELNNTLKKIANSDSSGSLTVAYYDKSDGKLYGVAQEHLGQKMPIWFMDFFLEYKGNFNCYSMHKEIELKYPIKFVMDPTRSNRLIYFKITIREKPFNSGFNGNCEDICFVAKEERENPLNLSAFVKKQDYF